MQQSCVFNQKVYNFAACLFRIYVSSFQYFIICSNPCGWQHSIVEQALERAQHEIPACFFRCFFVEHYTVAPCTRNGGGWRSSGRAIDTRRLFFTANYSGIYAWGRAWSCACASRSGAREHYAYIYRPCGTRL